MFLGCVILSKVVPCPFPFSYSSNYLLPSGGGSQGSRTKARRGKKWENQGAHCIGRKSAGGASQVPALCLLTLLPSKCTPHPSHKPPLLLHTSVFTKLSCRAHNECPIIPIIQSSFYLKEKHPLKWKAAGDFPGGPVVKKPCFQYRGCRFNPWSGTKIPHTMRPTLKK